MQEFTTTDKYKIRRISRWIRIRCDYNITERHSLYAYADAVNENSNKVTYFIWRNRKWAIGQFLKYYTNPPRFIDASGKLICLSGYDSTSWYNPAMIEFDDFCNYVRLYEIVLD